MQRYLIFNYINMYMKILPESLPLFNSEKSTPNNSEIHTQAVARAMAIYQR